MTDYSDTDQTCLLEGSLYHPRRFTKGVRIGELMPCAHVKARGLCGRHYGIARGNGDLAELALPDARGANRGTGRKRVEYASHCETCKCKP